MMNTGSLDRSLDNACVPWTVDNDELHSMLLSRHVGNAVGVMLG